jgi:AcrR family transcriptional regulator
MVERVPATPARERLLDAGVELFAELPPADLFGGLTVSALARRGQTTRATFYHHWPTLDAYFADLAAHAFAKYSVWQLESERQLPSFLDPANSRSATLRAASATELDIAASNPAFAMRLILAANVDDPTIVPILQRFHRERDQAAEEVTGFLWGLWHREPRPPFTFASVAALWTALVDGLAMRKRIDPDFDAGGLFGDVAVALLPATSRGLGEQAGLDQWTSSIDRFPTSATASSGLTPSAMTPQQRGELGAAVLRAAFALLEERAWTEISMSDLAAEAQVDDVAVFDAFGSKAGVAALVLSQFTHRRIVDLRPLPDPIDHLRQVMRTLRSVIREHRVLARATLLTVTDNAPGAMADTAAGLTYSYQVIADGIGRAQDAGQIRPEIPALPLALHWSRSILLEQVTHGVDGQQGFDLVDVLLNGVRTPTPA